MLPTDYKIYKEFAPEGIDGTTPIFSKMDLKSFAFGDIVEVVYEIFIPTIKNGFSTFNFANQVVLLAKIGTYISLKKDEKLEFSETDTQSPPKKQCSRWIL